MNRSVLVLGAGGLLGGSLLTSLSKSEYEVGALGRSIGSGDLPEGLHVQLYPIDVMNKIQLDEIISRYDVIVNCVGQITDPISGCLSINTSGITNIVESIKRYQKKIIHVSSVSVYGSALSVDEQSPLSPETVYGSVKCFAEYLIETNLENYIILRVSNLYGKRQRRGVLNYLLNSYRNGSADLAFNNNGKMLRYYLQVDDLSRCICELISKNDVVGIFNVVGDDKYDIRDLVALSEDVFGFKFNAHYSEAVPPDNIDEIRMSKLGDIIGIDYMHDVFSFLKDGANEKCR